MCACCGEKTLPANSAFEICPVCGWQDDDVQNDDPDLDGGSNEMSLRQARETYAKNKVYSIKHTKGFETI